MTSAELHHKLDTNGFDKTLTFLYGEKRREAAERVRRAVRKFSALFGENRGIRIFSAPGRTEVGGNHTDHQNGRVLAAAVDRDVLCIASPNGDNIIRIQSEGHPRDEIDLSSPDIREDERNHAASLIRGIAARCRELGYRVEGFDAYTTSMVPKGSGLSSSAAFEVAVGTMISRLFNDGKIPSVQIARIGQYAENVYFGKPSGLMDQMASAVGGFVAIDFADPENPVVEPLPFDFGACGHSLCIVDTGGNHADLTGDYASIPREMRSVAELFGAQTLREVKPAAFFERLPEVRERCGDRAALRAMHFFSDNERVALQTAALKEGNFDAFKRLVIESGRSSFNCLQNIYAPGSPHEQGLSLALAVSELLLAPQGAWRVHGGGFAGTIQAFVPHELFQSYYSEMERLFIGCHVLSVRPAGGYEITD